MNLVAGTAQARGESGQDPRPVTAIQPATGSAISSVVIEAWSITSNIPASPTPRMAAAQHNALRYPVMVKLPCYDVKEARHVADLCQVTLTEPLGPGFRT